MKNWNRIYIYTKGVSELDEFWSEYLFNEIAECYCGIWKEAPWCEDFWEPEKVSGDIAQELSRDGAIGVFALEHRKSVGFGMTENHGRILNCQMVLSGGWTNVSGFSWGYPVTPNELYEISGQAKPEWEERGASLRAERIFYIDELGVSPMLRRRGYGEDITKLMVITAKLSGYKSIMLRTDVNASAAVGLYRKIGFCMTGVRDKEYPNREYLSFNGSSVYWPLKSTLP